MPVFAHGQLRLYLLALLDEGPRHGYEIIRALEERFNGLYSPSAGTVYPRLAKLEEEGLVERSEDGRKSTYRITDAGRAQVHERRYDVADLQQDLDHSVRQLADEVRARVHGSAQNLREELRSAAKEARRTATPAGGSYGEPWSHGSPQHRGPVARDIEAAVNAFRFEVRDAVRRVQTDEAARKEVLDILADSIQRIRHVLNRPQH